MEQLVIEGGHRLVGEINISGAKNAALPIMAASLLTKQELVLHNVPDLTDVRVMMILLESLGAKIKSEKSTLIIKCDEINNHVAKYDIVRKMRSSILVLAPLLACLGYAKVSLPGGCAIGARPVDLHLLGLRAMGCTIDINAGYIEATVPQGGLRGAEILLPVPTVTGTENLMMAATIAKGETRIINAAREPEIVDLGKCLAAMGAKLSGLGTDTITIAGVHSLHRTIHTIIPDRLEAVTYGIAAAITGGEIEAIGAKSAHLPIVLDTLKHAGVDVHETDKGIIMGAKSHCHITSHNIVTAPFPGFPTDLQAQFMALMCVGDGESIIKETIFENRFMHVCELARMGATIQIDGHSAIVHGIAQFNAAEVMATDLRASVALVIAALNASGTSVINRIYHLERGYANLVTNLNNCGAKVYKQPQAS